MKPIVKSLLSTIAGIADIPAGAHNIRVNGQSVSRADAPGIAIVPKPDSAGIEIRIQPGLRNETIHIPVLIDQSGLTDVVANEFYIGDECDIHIIAGCGIHNSGHARSRHDGVHTFHVGKNARVKYTETHYGSGEKQGERILNPATHIFLDTGSLLEMESFQLDGVDATDRVTYGKLSAESSLRVTEKILTDGVQKARTEFTVDLDGENCSADIVSRSVAKGHSTQEFFSRINGNNACTGHSECDAIIMDHAVVKALPEITANHLDASLIHEAAIGKIAGEQITKLLTLGLDREEAEAQIIRGFLR